MIYCKNIHSWPTENISMQELPGASIYSLAVINGTRIVFYNANARRVLFFVFHLFMLTAFYVSNDVKF